MALQFKRAKGTSASLQATLTETQASHQQASRELATQKRINHTLMRAKEKVEWELMEALVDSDGNQPSVALTRSSVDEANNPHLPMTAIAWY